jgi:hypothetical protein
MHMAKVTVRAEHRPMYGVLRIEICRHGHAPILGSDGVAHDEDFFPHWVTDEDKTVAAIEQIIRARTVNTKVKALRRYTIGRVQVGGEQVLLIIAHKGAKEGRLLVVGAELTLEFEVGDDM